MTEIILTKKKEMDLFTLDGLIKQTGVRSSNWDRYILKELIDNAIDACESSITETPEIKITINNTDICIRDNGPGLSRETIDKITNLNTYAGSKYYYARPSRGRQGNALLTILPMPYVLSGSEITECATIRSGTKQFSIFVEHDDIQQDYIFRVDESDLPEEINGTEISVKVSLTDMHGLEMNEIPDPSNYISLISSVAVFNPHCEFAADIFGEKIVHNKIGEVKKMKSESESIHWYSYSSFKDLIYAYLRAGHGSATIKNFCMSWFRGINNSTKNDSLLKSMSSKKLEHLREKETDIRQLYVNLKEICRILSPSVLGEIGEDQLQSFFGSDVHGTRYKKVEENLEMDGCIIPYVLEGIATQTDERTVSSKLYTGLNNSPLFSNNSIARLLDHGELRISDNDRILTAIHLTCPNVSFSNYSKAEFDLTPFMPAIRKVLKSILGDYYNNRDKAEKERNKEHRRELKEREEREKKEKRDKESKEKEKKQTIIEAFEKTIALVYLAVTVNGRFESYIRQAYYKHRPIIETCGLKLGYSYYENTLVPEWEIKMGRRMFLRETRGVLLLPGEDEYIQIDTKLVNNFVLPKWKVKNVFYIEKRGFADALRIAEIHKRYDIAILSGQGFTTEDIKLILHKVARTDSEIKVFCFHDCDIYGIHIHNSAGKEHYIEGTKVTITSLGILPKEAEEKKYSVEWYEPPKGKTGKIIEYSYDKLVGVISPEDFKWLTEVVDGKRRRVELNIFSPLEFIAYVKEKIKEAEITEKVLPPVDVIEDTIAETIKSDKEDIVTKAIDKNTAEINDVIEKIKTAIIDRQEIGKTLRDEFDDFVEIDPEELRETVKTDLEDNPPESWKHFTEMHVREHIRDLPEWEDHVKETIDTNTNGKVMKLLSSVLKEISKNPDFAKSPEL